MIFVDPLSRYFQLYREEKEAKKKKEEHGTGFDEILEEEKEKLSAASHRITPNNSKNISFF